MSPHRILLAALLCAASLFAQFPYGFGVPGAGGITPRLDCGAFTSGSPTFAFEVTGATGGSTGLLALSFAPDSSAVGSLPLWVNLNPGALIDLRPLFFGGAFGAPGAGFALDSFSVPFPPQLLGFDFYAQAVIADAASGLLASTQGLRVELSLEPTVFVGTSVGGSSDPVWVVDPVTPSVITSFTAGFNNVSGGAYGLGNSRAYAALNLGAGIQEIDLTTAPPQSQVFYAAAGSCYGLGVDPINNIIYTLNDGPGGASARELLALDGDINSPTYGTVLAQTMGLSSFGFVERMSTSPSGRQTAVLSVFNSRLLVVNTDPGSPNWMSWTDLGAVPAGPSAFAVATTAAFTPDEDQILVPVQLAGPIPGEIARYSFALNGWVDHDLSTPSIDNIGTLSAPIGAVPSAPTGIAVAKSGAFAVVSGFGAGGSAVRIDLDAGNPFTWSTTPLLGASGLAGAWALTLVNRDTEIAVGTFGVGPSALVFIDVTTGLERARVALPGASNVYTIVGG